MSKCSNPIYALDLGVKENGKRNIKLLPKRYDLYSLEQLSYRYGSDNIIPLPCGKCLACRLNKGKEWAVRCVLEASLYDNNYFVTLTYDDQFLPASKEAARRDIQLFFKRLRQSVPGLRYFGCCEKGSHTKRFHHHIILFNCDLPDYRPLHRNINGGYLFDSKLVREAWSKGFITIGEVNYTTCGYVAQYASKKVFNDDKDEFIYMSTKPGIGSAWLEKHYEIFKHDSIFGKFGFSNAVKIPRYFEKCYELINPEALSVLKGKRLDKSIGFTLNEMLLHGIAHVEQLGEYNGDIEFNKFCNQKKGIRKDL